MTTISTNEQALAAREAERKACSEQEAQERSDEVARSNEERSRAIEALLNETVEDRTARIISDDEGKRARQAERDEISAALAEHRTRREAAIAAQTKAERQGRIAINPHLQHGDTPARRAAKLLRDRMGADLAKFLADLKVVGVNAMETEIDRLSRSTGHRDHSGEMA